MKFLSLVLVFYGNGVFAQDNQHPVTCRRLVDYIKFIRLQLCGIEGKENRLTKNEFNYLLFGLPVFSMGWFNKADGNSKNTIAFNTGNAGAFITEVQIVRTLALRISYLRTQPANKQSKALKYYLPI